jgi:C4-dicarboxylate-specific signal transduction histidine kinase
LLGNSRRFWRLSPETFIGAAESRFRREEMFQGEMEVETLDGRVINVVVTIARPAALSALGANFLGFVDITDQVRATAMLQKLQAEFAHTGRVSMLGELTASIAHEINQPLTAIMANGEASLRWLNRSDPDIMKADQAMQRTVDAASRAAEIVSRIRSMAAGRAPQYMEVSLNEIIDEAIEFLGHQLKTKNVDVSLDLDRMLPRLTGDRVQLQQVVVNLVINAVQAMDQASILYPAMLIRTSRSEDNTLQCCFEDAGPGIDQHLLDRLFSSFFTTKDSGMGMGLPVSKSIVEAHGGKLRADNKSVLGGARFIIALPVRSTEKSS